MNSSRQQQGLFMIIFFVGFTIIIYTLVNRSSVAVANQMISVEVQKSKPPPSKDVSEIGRVLILYVWGNTDVQSLGNLEFFILHGVRETQPADYYFILQRMNKTAVDESLLPVLPSNAHYVQHENECRDIGTFGWFLSQNITNTTAYKYFIFMNSSVRGPFLVPYFETFGIWWFDIFIRRLNDRVKLVGPSINCEQQPHVQSYMMATDRVGFQFLTGNGSRIFSCHASQRDAVFNGEIAASQMLLKANYQIASLQSKYQGWDFEKPENQGCNYGASPIFRDGALDTIQHDPFELIFVKFKGNPPFDTELERRALIYQKWLDERPFSIKTNLTNQTKTH